MSLNSVTIKKILLTAGLLLVLGRGALHLPELHNYLFPAECMESVVKLVTKEFAGIKVDLGTLRQRVDYLEWFQTHNGPDLEVSATRLRAFPFSETIRLLAPGYFWQVNIILARKNQLRVERKLRYLEGLFKNIDTNAPDCRPQAGPAVPATTAAASSLRKEIQPFIAQWPIYSAQLIGLTKQLDRLENNGYTQ